MPAQSVMVRSLAPQAGLISANALMSGVFQGTMIISPAIAGALVSTLIPSAATLAEKRALGPFLHELTVGLRFIFIHSAIFFVMIAMTAGMLELRHLRHATGRSFSGWLPLASKRPRRLRHVA